MQTIRLKGRITEAGGLDLELPPGLPPGDARVTIEIPAERGWTVGEIEQALATAPLTGAEIVRGGFTGGWAGREIADGEDWVRAQRERRREERRGR
ncbi:MAG TPA: hypothetical protein DD490_10110 [Acidobacteria bacterium]|nr:hypothetical protein [Acidobacteriota bacterium]